MAILNRTALTSSIAQQFVRNGVGAITADTVRSALDDLVDSAFNKIDDTVGGGGFDYDFLNHKAVNLLDPTDDTDAATKAYVDSKAGGSTDFAATKAPAATNATPSSITSLGTSLANPRIGRTIPRDHPLSIYWWLDPTREYGIRNRTDLASCQTAIASALASGEDIDLGPGLFHITDQLVMSRQSQRVQGRDRMTFPSSWMGTSFDINASDFNMAAGSVFKLYHECTLQDVAFDFYQPTITNVSQIKQYPWAIDLRDASRAKLRRIRVNRGWNGINGIVVQGTNTGGANTIRDVELGCFTYPFYFDAFSTDFLELDNVRCWVFGFSDRSDLTSAYYGGGSIGGTNPTCVFGQQDGLNVGHLMLWKTHLIYQNGSTLHGQISNLNLDGGGSNVEVKIGNLSIGNVSSLSDSPVSSFLVSGAATQVQVGNMRLNTLGIFGNANAALKITAGELQIGNLETRTDAPPGRPIAESDTRHILQTGGDLMISNWRPKGVLNAPRSTAMFEQTGGRVSIGYFRPEDKGSGSGNAIVATIDERNYLNGHLVGWGMSLPLTQNNAIINIK